MQGTTAVLSGIVVRHFANHAHSAMACIYGNSSP
jgi:hypothetical protein